jgi:flagellin-like hook-associated protein FlgL
MLPIGAGLSGTDVAVQRQVENAFVRLAETSLRLATFRRAEQARDDPAALIVAEGLRSELAALQAASWAAGRNRALVHVADSSLAGVSELLNGIDANRVAAAGDSTSPAERKALQMEIDAALEALDRMGTTASFAGRRLLAGESLEVLTGHHPGDLETLTLPDVRTSSLGGADGVLADLRSGGSASVDQGNPQAAEAIVDAARQKVTFARASLAAFQRYSIDVTAEIMQESTVQLTSELSHIVDADVAVASANLVQSMVLADAAVLTARVTLAARSLTAELTDGLLAVP